MPLVWSDLYYIKSRRRSRSSDNGAGGISSCLVRSPVCALRGKSGEGLANSDFSGSEYRPDMPSELDSRQEPMLREETRLELAGVGNGARLLEIGRWVSGCCRRLLSWLLGSEWKRHKQIKGQVRCCHSTAPLALLGQKMPVFKLVITPASLC